MITDCFTNFVDYFWDVMSQSNRALYFGGHGLIDMSDCLRCGSGLEETALDTFYYYEQVCLFWNHVREWTVFIVLLNIGYIVDNVDPLYWDEKGVVFLVILAMARMVIWTTRKKGLYEGANFSCDLIMFFRHQQRVKIRCDRKRFGCITLNKKWV